MRRSRKKKMSWPCSRRGPLPTTSPSLLQQLVFRGGGPGAALVFFFSSAPLAGRATRSWWTKAQSQNEVDSTSASSRDQLAAGRAVACQQQDPKMNPFAVTNLEIFESRVGDSVDDYGVAPDGNWNSNSLFPASSSSSSSAPNLLENKQRKQLQQEKEQNLQKTRVLKVASSSQEKQQKSQGTENQKSSSSSADNNYLKRGDVLHLFSPWESERAGRENGVNLVQQKTSHLLMQSKQDLDAEKWLAKNGINKKQRQLQQGSSVRNGLKCLDVRNGMNSAQPLDYGDGSSMSSSAGGASPSSGGAIFAQQETRFAAPGGNLGEFILALDTYFDSTNFYEQDVSISMEEEKRRKKILADTNAYHWEKTSTGWWFVPDAKAQKQLSDLQQLRSLGGKKKIQQSMKLYNDYEKQKAAALETASEEAGTTSSTAVAPITTTSSKGETSSPSSQLQTSTGSDSTASGTKTRGQQQDGEATVNALQGAKQQEVDEDIVLLDPSLYKDKIFERNTEKRQLLSKKVYYYFRKWVQEGEKAESGDLGKKFHYCTDDRAIAHLENQLQKENLNIFDVRGEDPKLVEKMLFLLTTHPQNQGDAYLRLLLKMPEKFGTSRYLVQEVLKNFYLLLWEKNRRLERQNSIAKQPMRINDVSLVELDVIRDDEDLDSDADFFYNSNSGGATSSTSTLRAFIDLETSQGTKSIEASLMESRREEDFSVASATGNCPEDLSAEADILATPIFVGLSDPDVDYGLADGSSGGGADGKFSSSSTSPAMLTLAETKRRREDLGDSESGRTSSDTSAGSNIRETADLETGTGILATTTASSSHGLREFGRKAERRRNKQFQHETGRPGGSTELVPGAGANISSSRRGMKHASRNHSVTQERQLLTSRNSSRQPLLGRRGVTAQFQSQQQQQPATNFIYGYNPYNPPGQLVGMTAVLPPGAPAYNYGYTYSPMQQFQPMAGVFMPPQIAPGGAPVMMQQPSQMMMPAGGGGGAPAPGAVLPQEGASMYNGFMGGGSPVSTSQPMMYNFSPQQPPMQVYNYGAASYGPPVQQQELLQQQEARTNTGASSGAGEITTEDEVVSPDHQTQNGELEQRGGQLVPDDAVVDQDQDQQERDEQVSSTSSTSDDQATASPPAGTTRSTNELLQTSSAGGGSYFLPPQQPALYFTSFLQEKEQFSASAGTSRSFTKTTSNKRKSNQLNVMIYYRDAVRHERRKLIQFFDQETSDFPLDKVEFFKTLEEKGDRNLRLLLQHSVAVDKDTPYFNLVYS
ncbi:unnamed protein product [Amoebophrya sp. A120]|nr:unnamed protein product [Amoebophrya sp. A120]|eukprot:GSA120T00023911001.1